MSDTIALTRALSMAADAYESEARDATAHLLREAAAAIGVISRAREDALTKVSALSRERDQLREYLNAAATDYQGAMETIRREGQDFMPKTVIEMAESATMLRRAAGGEDIWSEYQSELSKLRERHNSEVAALSRELEETKEEAMPIRLTPTDTRN